MYERRFALRHTFIREKTQRCRKRTASAVDVAANATGDFVSKKKLNKCKCKATGGTPPGCCVGTAVPSPSVESGRAPVTAALRCPRLTSCLPVLQGVRGRVKVPQLQPLTDRAGHKNLQLFTAHSRTITILIFSLDCH